MFKKYMETKINKITFRNNKGENSYLLATSELRIKNMADVKHELMADKDNCDNAYEVVCVISSIERHDYI